VLCSLLHRLSEFRRQQGHDTGRLSKVTSATSSKERAVIIEKERRKAKKSLAALREQGLVAGMIILDPSSGAPDGKSSS